MFIELSTFLILDVLNHVARALDFLKQAKE